MYTYTSAQLELSCHIRQADEVNGRIGGRSCLAVRRVVRQQSVRAFCGTIGLVIDVQGRALTHAINVPECATFGGETYKYLWSYLDTT